MKILSVPQIREADKFTIENEPISSLQLMERAATAIFESMIKEVHPDSEFHLLCGPGNNGGDGLVLARLLHQRSFPVTVWLIYDSIQPSEDNQSNLLALQKCKNVAIHSVNDASDIQINPASGHVILVDALFGSGLNRKLTGLWSTVLDLVNQVKAEKIAIDIPSGLFADQLNEPDDAIFIADKTYTLEFPKFSFFMRENAPYVGRWKLIPIGLHPRFVSGVVTKNYFSTFAMVSELIKFRPLFSHKGSYGHALLVAGSYGMMGAAILASKSCMRSGVGLLTTHIPKCGYSILQTTVPEALLDLDECETHFSTVDHHQLDKYNAIGIGSGLSKHAESASGLKLLIQQYNRPLVIDADALNILSENPTWLSFLAPGSILTPHPKEFERLTEKAQNSQEQLELLRNFAVKYQVVILLKGPYTAIASPKGELYFNSTGNPGMATAGSGDVLTGIILGLLAQGYASLTATILGVYLHGLSGDIAVKNSQSEESLIASDLIDHLGSAFRLVKKH
jgi:ADP-dependent NAD(P)H-hydrate dehydratase / NAD(P)H-hydrate epimerase